MRRKSLFGVAMAAGTSLAVGARTQATVLNFNSAALSRAGYMNQNYGDDVASSPQGGFTYGSAGGYTPNILTSYSTASVGVSAASLNTPYGNFSQSLTYYDPSAPTFWIEFDGTAGYQVSVTSLALGGYKAADYKLNSLTIFNGTSTTTLNNVDAPATQNVLNLSSYAASTGSSVRITFNDSTSNGYVGINNIQFSQFVPPPAPEVWSPTSGMSWNNSANWTPATIPNLAEARVSFLSGGGGGTVTLDSSQTVGQIIFDDTATSYTISSGTGTNTLTINDKNDAVVNPSINVNNGSHTIGAAIALANGVNINFLNSSGLTLSNTISGTGAIAVTGAGTLTINPTALLPSGSAMSINSGAKVALAACPQPSIPPVQTIASLTFDSNAASKLDIGNNEMIITGTVSTTIRTDITSQHIYSSLSNASFGVGYITSGGGTEVRYVPLGDTNLDGSVNFSDLLTLATHYGSHAGTWAIGDSNYDGTVNFSDLLALSANYGTSLSPSEAQSNGISASFAADWNLAVAETDASVPEPASLALLAVGGAGLLARRRRARLKR